jgi:hypothetical protein
MRRESRSRIDYLDRETGMRAYRSFAKSRRAALHSLEDTPSRLHALSMQIARHCMHLGLFAYALGSPLHRVRAYFAQAADMYAQGYRSRTPLEPIPVTLVTLPGGAGDNPRTSAPARREHEWGGRDESLTNSWTGRSAIYIALSVGEHTVAREIARYVYDPPDANYLGPRSEVLTPNQQRLAYAVRDLVLGDARQAVVETDGLERPESGIETEATLVQDIALSNAQRFRMNLGTLLVEHKRTAHEPVNRNDPEYFLSLPGLGLSQLAVRAGLVSPAELEPIARSSIYLPVALSQKERAA